MYRVNDAQHTPRQLKVKSSIKYYKLVAFCILRSADFSFSDGVCVCFKTDRKESDITSYCPFKDLSSLHSSFFPPSCTMAFHITLQGLFTIYEGNSI